MAPKIVTPIDAAKVSVEMAKQRYEFALNDHIKTWGQDGDLSGDELKAFETDVAPLSEAYEKARLHLDKLTRAGKRTYERDYTFEEIVRTETWTQDLNSSEFREEACC
ncbi:hypothetical protein EON81_28485 [bacterium]|nr:MAG: hypothetical protein EON81_28485 [bacterium]